MNSECKHGTPLHLKCVECWAEENSNSSALSDGLCAEHEELKKEVSGLFEYLDIKRDAYTASNDVEMVCLPPATMERIKKLQELIGTE